VRQPTTRQILLAALVAGILAGLVVGAVQYVVIEPVIERAIGLEEAAHAAAEQEMPVVSREVQRPFLVVGLGLYGLFIGLLFGVGYALVQPRFPGSGLRRNAFLAALAAGWLVGIFPLLKYPPNPPGVGDPETITYRQTLFVLFWVLSIGCALVAGWVHRLLRGRLAGGRLAAAALAAYAVCALLLYVLMPVNPDPVDMPPDLVRTFRVYSLSGIAAFWIILGLLFGTLLHRFQRGAGRRPRPGDQPTASPRPGRSGPPPTLELRHVTCSYGNEPVLENVSLCVEPGQFVGLVGPSGSGKTTLLKTALGLLRPVGGVALFGGRPIDGPPAGVGYVPQLETVDWTFPATAEEVVLMGRAAHSGPWPWAARHDRQEVHALLERLGLGGLAGRHIRDLSGGQQQRVFLARALLCKPALLVLDEPTSGVDIRTRHEILHLLRELQEDGTTILLTTHELNAVASHLPYVVCLNRTIIAQGPPASVFTDAVLSQLYGAPMHVVREGDVTVVVDHPDLLVGAGHRGSGTA